MTKLSDEMLMTYACMTDLRDEDDTYEGVLDANDVEFVEQMAIELLAARQELAANREMATALREACDGWASAVESEYRGVPGYEEMLKPIAALRAIAEAKP